MLIKHVERVAPVTVSLFLPPELPQGLMRAQDWRGWLRPLSTALGVTVELVAEPPANAGAPHPIVVHDVHVATLYAPERLRGDTVQALVAAFISHIDSRMTITDLAGALAGAWKEKNFLGLLAETLAHEAPFEEVATQLVKQLARVQRATSVALYLQRDGALALAAAYPPEAAGAGIEASLGDAASEPWIDARGSLVVPLLDGPERRGVLYVSGGSALARSDTHKFLTSVGRHITQAMRLRYLKEHAHEAAQMRESLEEASSMQRQMLPSAAPDFPGASVVGRCVPASQVGGDGYDFASHAEGLDVLIADVSGHGVAAGLLMSHFLASVRQLPREGLAPSEIAARLNRSICREVGLSGHFVTACYARLEPGARRLCYVSLGHASPMLWRRGEVSVLPCPVGMAAGLDDAVAFQEGLVDLEPGDRLLFYTDGLVEARRPDGMMFGDAGLADALKRAGACAPEDILNELFAACRAFKGEAPIRDDKTALVLAID